MKTLKFLRNVAVYAVHREAGSIHDIHPREAGELIASGAAVEFVPPLKTVPETGMRKFHKETAPRKSK